MDIIVKDLGKQFQEEWIFRNLDFHFQQGKIYAIRGPNGSGKSTLLQLLSGFLLQSTGEVVYRDKEVAILPENFYQYITVSTPYTELIEEFTAIELLKFHFQFKKKRFKGEIIDFLEQIDLSHAASKQLKNFSSGMKQRMKLGLAFFSDTPIVLLDEPTTNLDSSGIAWYQQLVHDESAKRLVIICSNQAYEYEQSDEHLNIIDYK